MRHRLGFTLTEVLIAVSVLTGGLAGAALLLTSAFSTYRHQGQTMEVFHVVHDQVEMLTATPYGDLKNAIEGARQPADPPRPDLPPEQDFSRAQAGDAVSRFDLEPKGPDDPTYEIKPKPAQAANTLTNKKPRGTLDAAVRLQYWDPTFDQPSMTDRGLIRASVRVKGSGVDDQTVKYVAR